MTLISSDKVYDPHKSKKSPFLSKQFRPPHDYNRKCYDHKHFRIFRWWWGTSKKQSITKLMQISHNRVFTHNLHGKCAVQYILVKSSDFICKFCLRSSDVYYLGYWLKIIIKSMIICQPNICIDAIQKNF